MYNDLERREYKRIEKLFMVRFKTRFNEAQEMWSDDWDSVFLINISTEGIFFYYTKDLVIDTLLDLKIYVPNAVLVINCVGKVIRINKSRHTSMFGIGIKITEVGELEKELINKSVEGILEQAKKASVA